MPDVIWKHAEQVDGAVTDKRCREQPDKRGCTAISRANKERNHCHRDNQPENIPLAPADQMKEEFVQDMPCSLNVAIQNAETKNKVLRW